LIEGKIPLYEEILAWILVCVAPDGVCKRAGEEVGRKASCGLDASAHRSRSDFWDPDIAAAQLSPDGQYIAFLKPWKDTRNIYPYCAENSVLQGGDAERGERSSP
jgi:hypothetical protein